VNFVIQILKDSIFAEFLHHKGVCVSAVVLSLPFELWNFEHFTVYLVLHCMFILELGYLSWYSDRP
jgi:hypothetical protein